MTSLSKRVILYPVLSAAFILPVSCTRTDIPTTQAADPASAPSTQPQKNEPNQVQKVLPSGTLLHVRLQETLDTKRNHSGDHFSATLDEPLVDGDRVVVPKGTIFSGHVVSAERSGRFKARAELTLSLDSFALNGHTYPIQTTDPAKVSSGHKKRNLLLIGGGTAAGAAIGAAAGGGTGALIGAGAGAGAGTLGAGITGKKDVSLPVESRMTFKLTKAAAIS